MDNIIPDNAGVVGTIEVNLFDEYGNVKSHSVNHNLVTREGDAHIALRAYSTSPTNMPSGMKLGTGSTAPAKSGAGAQLAAYLSGSNRTFDSGYPSSVWEVITFRCTWGPGVATSASPITEAAIVTDAGDNANSAESDVHARALVSGVSAKGAGDTLEITWTWTFTGV